MPNKWLCSLRIFGEGLLVNSFLNLFSSDELTPHGFCLLWRPDLVWLHVASDSIIGVAYYSIPIALAYFVWRREDLAFGWIFWLFGAFILACGTTHWFEIWTLWHPDYAMQGLLKAATAGISLITAFLLWPLLPKALALPSPSMLRRVNEDLSIQVRERAEAMEALQREMAERQRAEEALRQAQKLEALGQLTGGVAHDFNNLLQIIIGNVSILRQRGGTEGTHEFEAIDRALQRGESLTRQLLAFGRRQNLQPREVDLKAELPRMKGMLRHSVRGDITLATEIAPDLWPVEIDPNEFELAIINLAMNARDAQPRGGAVIIDAVNETLTSEEPHPENLVGDFVRLRVRDTGSGIPPDVLSRVFEPFFTTKAKEKGTGLGLSQVYGFARQSGGGAFIESEEGKGTTVTLHLPRSHRSAAMEGAAAEPSLRENGRSEQGTILVVEDNAEISIVTVALLQSFGYRTNLADTADDAFARLIQGEKADLVFTDIVMPGEMNGIELARSLRSRFPGLPVLLTTGYSAGAQQATQEGFTLLPKPYRPELLAKAIRTMLPPKVEVRN